MLSLLYVSTSNLDRFAEDELTDIVRFAVGKNLTSGITGALAHTGTHFAQFLEGPEPAIRDVMESIRRDARHANIRVVRAAYQSERRFPNWGMTLVDGGPAVQQLIERAIEADSAADWTAEELVNAMERGATPVL